jgi:glucose/arabinose dehydrogenase
VQTAATAPPDAAACSSSACSVVSPDATAAAPAASPTSWPDLSGNLPTGELQLPAGLTLRVFARDLPGARSLCLAPNGTLFVGTREQGKVYAVVAHGGDAPAGKIYTITHGRELPNGVAFRNGSLYVAEAHRIIRFDNIEQHLADPPAPVLVYDGLPPGQGHDWKYLSFGPDGKLYFNIGSPCNACILPEPLEATICRINADGSGLEVYARGVRQSVGHDWDPATGELWFTDNGRDNLGDNEPPDELDHAPRAGMNFGFPYCLGGERLDPEYGRGHSCSDYTSPALKLPAHVAPLGMKFYTGTQFPEHYRGGIFLCEHGSWNRSSKVGYQVIFVARKDGKPQEPEVFCHGWLQGQSAWGRPVDVALTAQGALLVSDDRAGVVYRIGIDKR